MKSVYPQFFMIFFVLSCSLKAKAAPTKKQTLGNAIIREADGNGPVKVEQLVTEKNLLIFIKKNMGISWKDARTACKNIGGDLASLKDYKDFDLIASMFQGEPYRYWFWVGGHFNGTVPNWSDNIFWNSGEPIPVNFQYWVAGDPSYRYSDCVFLYNYPTVTRQNGDKSRTALGNWPCYKATAHGYVCEV